MKPITLLVHDSYSGQVETWQVAQLKGCAKHGLAVMVLSSPERAATMRQADANRAPAAGPAITPGEADTLLHCVTHNLGKVVAEMFPGTPVIIGELGRPQATVPQTPPMDPRL